jgi:DNA replication initiation complex subunit (GINS family)
MKKILNSRLVQIGDDFYKDLAKKIEIELQKFLYNQLLSDLYSEFYPESPFGNLNL